MAVAIKPLAEWMRRTRFKPLPPPVFDSDNPTPAEVQFALELFGMLDADSQRWYGGERFAQRLRDRLSK